MKLDSTFGFKSTSDSLFKQAGYILCYSKDKKHLILNKLFIEEIMILHKFIFNDISIPEEKWIWRNIAVNLLKLKDMSKKEALKKWQVLLTPK